VAPPDPAPDPERLGVASQLADDYGCGASPDALAAIEVREVRGRVARARGCGHEALYLEVVHQEFPPDGYRVVFRYANLSDPAHAGDVAEASVAGAPSPDAELARAEVARWRSLVAAGARALACPPVETWPEWVARRSGPRARGPASLGVVEGCGKRAIFETSAETWGDALPTPAVIDVEVRRATDTGRATAAPVTAAPSTPAEASATLARLRADGASDLRCPSPEIVARYERRNDLHPLAIAEGCGRRVTYLPDGPLVGEGLRASPYRHRIWRVEALDPARGSP